MHSRSAATLLFALLALAPDAGAAQAMRSSPHPVVETAGDAARGTESRYQLALEIGYLSAGLSYAQRLGESPWSVGAGVWGAWEPPNTFDREIWEPVGVVAFGRYHAAPWMHADVGLTAARYLWADDCSECSGTLAGVRAAVLVGHRFLFVGPEVTAGWASDAEHGSQPGAAWGVQARLVLGWEP